MSRDIQTLLEYLDHVLTAIRRISRYTQGMDAAAFLEDELIQDAVLRNLENVGEACKTSGGIFLTSSQSIETSLSQPLTKCAMPSLMATTRSI